MSSMSFVTPHADDDEKLSPGSRTVADDTSMSAHRDKDRKDTGKYIDGSSYRKTAVHRTRLQHLDEMRCSSMEGKSF